MQINPYSDAEGAKGAKMSPKSALATCAVETEGILF